MSHFMNQLIPTFTFNINVGVCNDIFPYLLDVFINARLFDFGSISPPQGAANHCDQYLTLKTTKTKIKSDKIKNVFSATNE